MDRIAERDQQLRQNVPKKFHRFLFHTLRPNSSFNLITGSPSVGKTTLLLQIAEQHEDVAREHSLFISGDHLWFDGTTLTEVADHFYLNGGRYLLIDDFHKCLNGPAEISQILKRRPALKILATSRGHLHLPPELTRKSTHHHLPGLSFREFLNFRESIRIEPKKLGEIVSFHKEFSGGISGLFQPIPPFRRYLAGGFTFSAPETKSRLPGTMDREQSINRLLESDLPSIEGMDIRSVGKIKLLLGVILKQAPLRPNISDIARSLEVSRDSVYLWLSYLEQVGLVHLLHKQRGSNIRHRKPECILPGSPPMLFFGGRQAVPQALRLTFIVSQLRSAGHTCTLTENGALFLNGMTIHVGDKHQIKPKTNDGSHPILAADNIETGTENIIPLWMFGLLY